MSALRALLIFMSSGVMTRLSLVPDSSHNCWNLRDSSSSIADDAARSRASSTSGSTSTFGFFAGWRGARRAPGRGGLSVLLPGPLRFVVRRTSGGFGRARLGGGYHCRCAPLGDRQHFHLPSAIVELLLGHSCNVGVVDELLDRGRSPAVFGDTGRTKFVEKVRKFHAGYPMVHQTEGGASWASRS